MTFLEHTFAPHLRRFVDCAWTASESARDAGASSIVPDGCVELVVTLAGSVRVRTGRGSESSLPRAAVLGLATRRCETLYVGATTLVGVRLRPSGALRLFGDELRGLLDGTRALADLRPALARGMVRAAREYAGSGDAEPLEIELGRALLDARAPHERIERAMDLLHDHATGTTVAGVAGEIDLSPRQLDRRFDALLGIRPKLLGRIARFRAAFRLGMSASEPGWAAIAARCGYADQAHLCREFRAFAGAPPARTRAALRGEPDVRFLQD